MTKHFARQVQAGGRYYRKSGPDLLGPVMIGFVILLIAIGIVASISAHFQNQRDCESRGGVYIQTGKTMYTCLSKDILR